MATEPREGATGPLTRADLWALVAVLGVQAVGLFDSLGRARRNGWDYEEAPVAFLSVLASWVGPLQLARWTDQPRCGGCWVDGVALSPWISGVEASGLWWRAVPVAWTLLGTAFAFLLARRLAGTGAGVLAALLLALPGRSLAWLQVHSHGNHLESSVLALGCLLLLLAPHPRRALWAGLAVGLTLFVAWTPVGLLGVVCLWFGLRWGREAMARLGGGVLLGSVPVGVKMILAGRSGVSPPRLSRDLAGAPVPFSLHKEPSPVYDAFFSPWKKNTPLS